MRALVLLLLVAVSFFLVVEFYPSSEVAGAEEAAAAEEAPSGGEQAGFLARDTDRTESARAGGIASPDPSPRTTPGEPVGMQRETGSAGWLDGVETPAPKIAGEVSVASELLHGRTEDVRRALRQLPDFPEAKAKLAESFALAFEGDARSGLDLASGIDEKELTEREKALLQRALGGDPLAGGSWEGTKSESALVLSMEMLLESRRAAALLERGEAPAAARAFSRLILAELDAPWPASQELLKGWSDSLEQAQKRNRWHPKGEWASEEMVVQPGDTAIAIRKRYLEAHPDRIMCSGLILAANAVRGYLQPGQKLRIPTDEVRMLVDLSARWAVYLIGGEVAGSWPVGIGREGEETPTGTYTVGNKLTNPPWMRVGKETIPFGDPRNLLGTRWLGWYMDGVRTSYGFHGTSDPESVGKPSSDGCIRFRNEDVEELFEILPEGAPILVRP